MDNEVSGFENLPKGSVDLIPSYRNGTGFPDVW